MIWMSGDGTTMLEEEGDLSEKLVTGEAAQTRRRQGIKEFYALDEEPAEEEGLSSSSRREEITKEQDGWKGED